MPSSQDPRAAGCAGTGPQRADICARGGDGWAAFLVLFLCSGRPQPCQLSTYVRTGCWMGNTASSKPHIQASKVAHLSRNCREGLKGPQAVRNPSQPAGAPASAAGGGGAAGASYTTHLNRGRLDKATRAAAGGEGGRGPDGQDEEHTAGKGAAG